MKELRELAQKIQDKIMGLQNKAGRTGGGEAQRKVVNFRISFMHKVMSVIYHVDIVESIKKQAQAIVEKKHNEGKLIIGQDMMRESLALSHELEFKYTSMMEDIIYHTMSAIDNLPLLFVAFYRNVNEGTKFNSARRALNNAHSVGLKITEVINRNWYEWIEELHKFRGEIYHYHSQICTGHMEMNLGRDASGGQTMTERFVIKIPQNLRDSLRYPADKEIEISEFCNDISKRALNY